MEHLCYKCQTSIGEALPFCPHCGAPQIRVTPADDASPSLPAADGNPQALRPSWTPGTPTYHPQGVQWEVAWKGAVLSGLLAAVLTALSGLVASVLAAPPLVAAACCLWLLGAGALAVRIYQRRVPGAVVTPGMGGRIGALAGAVGFVASTIWSVLSFTSNSQEFRSALLQELDRSAAKSDPQAQEIMRQFMTNLNTPEGLATFFVLMLVIMAIIFVVFGAAGGALGASMFARRNDLR